MSVTHYLAIPPETDVTKRMRLARSVAGLNQDDMARALGVSLATIGRLEQGMRKPRLGELIAWAQITKVDVSFFGTSSPGTNGEASFPQAAAEGN
jgi:transcriptional regulator with XRE-family HTH domain